MLESSSDVVVSKQKSARPPPMALGINVEKPKFPQYAVYSKRMESFENWPEYIPVKKDDLVEAGLVYTGLRDETRCYFCGGGLRNWEQDDVPMEEHAKWYPKCPHVMLVKGPAYIERIQRGEKPEEPLQAQANPACAVPNHLESVAAIDCIESGYSKEMVQKAINTFIDRHGNSDFKAADLCEILFDLEKEVIRQITQGVGDCVRCYFCGGGLRNWVQYDAPMEEHGKWYPKCPHVRLVKGQAYIERLQRGEKPEEPLPAQTNSACTAPNYLESLAARSFIHHGYSKEMVQKAIDIFIDRHGNSDFEETQLAEIILFELEEEVEQITQGNHFFAEDHLFKNMDELQQGSGPFLDSRNHNQTRKEEYESKLNVPSWALNMVKQLTSVIDDTLKTAAGVLSFLAKRFPSLFPDLKREPTEKDLFTFAEAIGNNFKQLAHALGVSASKLDRISMDNETSLMKIYSMLKEWQSSNPLTASLESLVKTMKTCKSVTVDWDKIGEACF